MMTELAQTYTSAILDHISVNTTALTHTVPTVVHAGLAIPFLAIDSVA